MSERPALANGYLGQQPKFSELGLSTFSHMEPEIRVNDNQVEIKIKTSKDLDVKVTHQLISCRTDVDLSEYVFTQTLHGVISFIISMPESGWYKFQIFALPTDTDSKQFPNVYNYVINCVRALHPVFPFPKQYAQWKTGCYLHEPLFLHKELSMKNTLFKAIIPNAKAAAVVVGDEWLQLEKVGNHWEGRFNMDQFKGSDKKITLNANTGPDESKFATLLEYKL